MVSMEEQKKYVEIIACIDESYKQMQSVRPLKESEVKYYFDEFSISATHNSNAIEGNSFTFDETKLLIEKGIVVGAHPLRDGEDIIGYKKAVDFLYAAVKEKRVIDEAFIKEIHSCVLRGEEGAGEYRNIQNYIGSLSNVVFTPCPPREVPEKMRVYVQNLKSDIEKNSDVTGADRIDWSSLFHRLAAHHIEFERIHPFIDGNGRTGRLLLIYEMISLGLLPVDIRYEERKRYFAAIKAYDDKQKYSTRERSKTEALAKLLAESELASMTAWLNMFAV